MRLLTFLFILLGLFSSCQEELIVKSKEDLKQVNDPAAPISRNINPSNGEKFTEKIILLEYTDVNNDLANNCSVFNLTNIVISTPCSCNLLGACTIGVTPIGAYSGNASFDYTVTANSDVSNTSTMNYVINHSLVTISNITSTTPGDGTYTTGQVIDIIVTFSEAITTSSSTLTLDSGATATYQSGSGTTAIVYRHTVTLGQNSTDLNVTTFTVGDAVDAVSIAPSTTLPAGQNLADNQAIIIDTAAPNPVTVVSPSDSSTVATPSITITGACETDSVVSITGDLQVSPTTGTCVASSYSINVNLTVASGVKNLSANQTDLAGNTSSSLAFSYTLGSSVVAIIPKLATSRGSTYGDSSCFIHTDGKLLCTGSQDGGALGNGVNSSSYILIPNIVDMTTSGLTNKFLTVSLGTGGCAVNDNLNNGSFGKLLCWGEYPGDGLATVNTEPEEIDMSAHTETNEFKQVSQYHTTTCAVHKDDKVFCWGNNSKESWEKVQQQKA